MKKKITIFTPTYNRKYILHKLYESLLNQTSMDFEWVMVDDGSTDDTNDFAEKVKKEGKIDFKYIYQENSGKPQAINTGAKNSNCEYFMCVDSDDTLSRDCVEKMIKYIDYLQSNDAVGIITLKKNIKSQLKNEYGFLDGKKLTLQELYFKYHFKGETALLIKTKYLIEFPYPKFSDEKFIPETWQYDILDNIGYWIFKSDILYYYEYLPDGYTFNFVKLVSNNVKSYKEFSKQRMKIGGLWLSKLKGALYYDLCCIIEQSYEINFKNNFVIRFLMYPISIFLYKKKGFEKVMHKK